jgi:UDP-GlcNAc:undecaprenyl-phosphate GlcNAc-1-phosphate transferase
MAYYKYMAMAAAAFLIALVLTPVARQIGFALNAVDRPGGRHINRYTTPRSGGLAIFLAFGAVFLYSAPDGPAKIGIALGATVIFILGFLDDLYRLSAPVKLAVQIVVALIVVAFGVRIRCISHPLGGFTEIGAGLGIPLTIFWMVAMMNMINLIDGLDGLAGGVTAIAGSTLFFIAIMKGQVLAAIMCSILVGATLAFLLFNFYPAKVFMGDGGALLLGYILGVISVQGALKAATAVTLVIPVLALGVPFFDTLLAIVRRVKARQPIMAADRGHLHHKMLDLGLSQRQTVLILYLISAVLGGAALISTVSDVPVSALFFMAFLGTGVYGGYKIGVIKHEPRHGHVPGSGHGPSSGSGNITG